MNFYFFSNYPKMYEFLKLYSNDTCFNVVKQFYDKRFGSHSLLRRYLSFHEDGASRPLHDFVQQRDNKLARSIASDIRDAFDVKDDQNKQNDEN